MVIEVISLCTPGYLILYNIRCVALTFLFCARCVWHSGTANIIVSGRFIVVMVGVDQFSHLSLWYNTTGLLKSSVYLRLHSWWL